MRNSNYDKYPATLIENGYILTGWDEILAVLAQEEKVLAVDFYTGVLEDEVIGQLKTLLDRANPLYTTDYHFRDIYVLTSAAEDEAEVPERAVAGVGGWIDCFEKARLAGSVFAGGVNEAGEIK